MIYNGFDFAPWFDTRLVTRSLLPEYEIATRDVPGQPGSRFMRAELKPLTIDVAAAWRARPADDMAALRRLMASRPAVPQGGRAVAGRREAPGACATWPC